MSEKPRIIIPKPGMKVERTDVSELYDPQDGQLAPEDKYVCLVCGKGFPAGFQKSYIQHVSGCYVRNEGVCREASLRVKMPYLQDPALSGDQELKKYYKDPYNVEKERKLIEKDSK